MRKNNFFLYGGVTSIILLTILGIQFASSLVPQDFVYNLTTGEKHLIPVIDGTVILATALACLSLVVTSLTKRPRLILAGIYIYLWGIGLALSYIASGSARKMWYWILLPIDTALYGFLFSFFASLLMILFHKQLWAFFCSLTGFRREEKRRREAQEQENAVYQHMYYSAKDNAYMLNPSQTGSGDAYEMPQSIYPPHPSPEGISNV